MATYAPRVNVQRSYTAAIALHVHPAMNKETASSQLHKTAHHKLALLVNVIALLCYRTVNNNVHCTVTQFDNTEHYTLFTMYMYLVHVYIY